MTNADKYLKDEVSVEKFINDYLDFSFSRVWEKNENSFENITKKFFEQQVKPQLTEDEKAILRHLKGFYYIYRASTGELEATNKEHTWCGYELYLDDDVFQFIKERGRILY